ncbi:MAG: hypothetical protein Q9159_003305 [Coniocarpon cinnabarinum]
MSNATTSQPLLRAACRAVARKHCAAPQATPQAFKAPFIQASRRIHTARHEPTRSTVLSSRRPTASSSSTNTSARTLPQRRNLFIQTEPTPNQDALKFKPNSRILPEDFPSSFLEYTSPRATISPPHPSPLAGQLLAVDGVTAVFYGADYITITKDSSANWAHVRPEVFSLITEAVSNGSPMVTTIEGAQSQDQGMESNTLAASDEDSEVVSMVKELLETRIRPAIQEDGGDIDFRGFQDGWVKLKLRGACRTCDSSTVTLRNGIESMLMHYVEEVKGVEQVMDEEEQIAMREFERFEEKLKQQKGAQAIASTGGKGTLDTAEA